MTSLPPLALTMGDPAGIGGDVSLKAWQALRNDPSAPPFFLITDADHLKTIAGDRVPISVIETPDQTRSVFPTALPVLHRPLTAATVAGTPNPDNAPAILGSIDTAVRLVQQGLASAVVTNPIHKQSLYQAGFIHPGHTEYLAALAGISTPPVMMLACPSLRVVPLTVHMALADAIESLSTDLIVTLAEITAQALVNDFAIADPHLAIAGLNPHAGEGGGMGNEENTIIAPAIDRLNQMGIAASGPWPPDTLFHQAARTGYDAAICMYHDQALIPIKTIDFHGAVNVTLGLPFVRTSPDHGTAFDIAGSGRADDSSLRAALGMAALMAARRSAS
ncbi:MAG TPA: 4-hydroxythreonine-4-phosphate dehydrogenase PdxA [Rhodospirillales bacterium]|nr:4-hydroxythreonine-4-phosphate dehydrogenase PdxA [Rhodospirillales bacterium]